MPDGQDLIFGWFLVTSAGYVVYCILVVLLLLLVSKKYPVIAGFDKTFVTEWKSDIGWGLFLFFVLMAVVIVYKLIAIPIIFIFDGESPGPVKSLFLGQAGSPNTAIIFFINFLLFSILFPAYEEISCRGFLQDRFSKLFSPKFGLLAQAVCFSMLHYDPIFSSGGYFFIGLTLGYWRYKRRTLLPIILAHGLFNCVLHCFKGATTM